jgi:hypothetical protein
MDSMTHGGKICGFVEMSSCFEQLCSLDHTQICNGILNAPIPMMTRTVEFRRESNRPRLTAGARTMGEVNDVDRYWGDRVADSPHSPV